DNVDGQGARVLASGVRDYPAEDLNPRPVSGSTRVLEASTPMHPHPARGRVDGCLIGQPGLADPRFSAETQYLAASGERRTHRGVDLAQLVLSAYEWMRGFVRARTAPGQ